MKNTSLKSKISAGFSLVELLVVIAVIGVIAAIAIPNIGNITSSASEASHKRNAQNLASVYSAAMAAGRVDTTTGAPTKDAAVTVLIGDGYGPIGGATSDAFGSQPFRVSMSAAEATEAKAYLDTDMTYTGNN